MGPAWLWLIACAAQLANAQFGVGGAEKPWDTPGTVQAAYPIPQPQAASDPIVIGGTEFSREDDIGNMEKLSNLFGQIFYTSLLSPDDKAAHEAWSGLSSDVWALADYAAEVPSLALSVAMCLYNYFWWEGPHSLEPNVKAGKRAAELMYLAIRHANCNHPGLQDMAYFIQQCHLRWRYVFMLTGEVGRHLVLQQRNIRDGIVVLQQLRSYFSEYRQLPLAGLLHGISPHEVNFNVDYYPSSVAHNGPIWHSGRQDVPIAAFLETHYTTFRAELEAILTRGTFRNLDEQTRNAETQFGPRGDDWLTAYLFRKGEAIPSVCQHAPRTCELLATRPEIAGCAMGGSGAGFLRMAPGGRLKPHFGNAPRLSVHLGLIVPAGEIKMAVGYEYVKWEEGMALVFDDTFIHQVVHNGEEPRYVLNVWMCHPCDPVDGKAPGEAVPDYCKGPPGLMSSLGLVPLPPQST